jgi:hypothetical protein
LGRVLTGAAALLLSVSFFLPAIDFFGEFSPREGVEYMADEAEIVWRSADVLATLGCGAYAAVIALPHLFGVAALLQVVLGRRWRAQFTSILLIVWWFALTVMLSVIVLDGGFQAEDLRMLAHLAMAAIVILLGYPWLRRPLPRWTETALVRRGTLVAAVTCLVWFTMWIEDALYGLYLAILASAGILVGTLLDRAAHTTLKRAL